MRRPVFLFVAIEEASGNSSKYILNNRRAPCWARREPRKNREETRGGAKRAAKGVAKRAAKEVAKRVAKGIAKKAAKEVAKRAAKGSCPKEPQRVGERASMQKDAVK